VLDKLETLRLNGSHSTSAYRRIAVDGLRLPTTEQAFQRLDPGVAVPIPKLGEC
jgi:hypothetical protein